MDDAPGRAWFEKFHQAFLQGDTETIWSMQTTASHELLLARMAETIRCAAKDDDVAAALLERFGPDIREMEPMEAWEAYTRESCRGMADGRVTWRYAGEEREGDRIVVRLFADGPRAWAAGAAGEFRQVLRLEDGTWKLDKPATEDLLARD